MSAYGYRGRHRKPTNTGKAVARAAVASAVAAGPSLTMVGTANAAPDWSAVIACESGGNPQAQNGSSTASGLFQFINKTWKAYGGSTARARDASVAEQYAVANRAYAAEGFGPWSASRSCWQGRTSSRPVAPAQTAKPWGEQVQAKPRQTSAPAFDSGRAADGSGSYTCNAGHLHFQACDPDTLGRRVAYPAYSRTPAPVASRGSYTVKAGDTLTGIAAARATTWREIAARNAVHNPDLIFPGQHLDV